MCTTAALPHTQHPLPHALPPYPHFPPLHRSAPRSTRNTTHTLPPLSSSPLLGFDRTADMGVNPEAVAEAYHAYEAGEVTSPISAAALSSQTIQESMRLLLMVRAYQVRMPERGGEAREGGRAESGEREGGARTTR